MISIQTVSWLCSGNHTIPGRGGRKEQTPWWCKSHSKRVTEGKSLSQEMSGIVRLRKGWENCMVMDYRDLWMPFFVGKTCENWTPAEKVPINSGGNDLRGGGGLNHQDTKCSLSNLVIGSLEKSTAKNQDLIMLLRKRRQKKEIILWSLPDNKSVFQVYVFLPSCPHWR